jgi:hypothetical protein
MRHHSHWTYIEKGVVTSDGYPLRLRAWGGGGSLSSAQDEAEIELARLAAKANKGLANFMDRDYGYPDRAMREEVITRINDQTVISWARYGAPILNTECLMIVDVDTPPDSEWRKIWNWICGEKRSPEDRGWGQISKWSEAHPKIGMRVYKTRAGWRVLIVDQPRAATQKENISWMKEMGADPLYVRLCGLQRCFRARLGPKPWRIGMEALGGWINDKTDPTERARVIAWRAQYQMETRQWRICDAPKIIGDGIIHPDLVAIVEYHDQECRIRDIDKPLA